MKTTDLMCGDWVLINGTPRKIRAIDSIDAEIQDDDDLYYIGEDRYHSEDEIEGIPLTKEMLDANGFRYEEHYGQYHTRSIIGDYRCTSKMCVSVTWRKSPEGLHVAYYIDCFNNNEHNGNSVTIQSNLYVHTLQHALRVVGLSEIADNFKI